MLDLLLVVVVFAVDFLLIISFIRGLNLWSIQLSILLASSASLLLPFVDFGNRYGEFIKLVIIILALVSIIFRLFFLFFKRIKTLILVLTTFKLHQLDNLRGKGLW